MSDSLTRLVLRAKGALPAVEPLLPSRYAAPESQPLGWGEALAETEAPGLASPRPIDRVAPEGLPSRLPEPQTPTSAMAARSPTGAQPVIEPVARPVPPAPDAARPRTAAHDTMDDDASAAAERRIAPPLPPPRGLAPGAAERPAHAPSAPAAESADPAEQAGAIFPPPRPIYRAGTIRTSPVLAARSETEEAGATLRLAGPEVSISIARVEVHAAPPRPAAVRPSPARRPAVSLADYLARRSGRAL